MKPLVSIIMGAYNCESTITACIESIRNQTYHNWEFIICDDCSTDNTLSILHMIQKKDDRIIILHNNYNMRLAASLNNCLSIARGKYIARMDADDESMCERLEKQVEFLESHSEYDVVGCDSIIFDENGERGIRKSVEFPTKSLLVRDTPFAHPTIMMKKSVYDDLGGYTSNKLTMRAEDLDLWFRFFENGYNGYNMQVALYKYREGESDFLKRSLKAGIQTSKVFWNGYKKIKIPIYKRIWVFKPIISALIPNKIMMWHHSEKLT